MRLTLVQTSHEDKRTSRSEAMATGDYVQLKVFSLVFLMRREEQGLEFARDAPLTLAKIAPPQDAGGKAIVKVCDICGHACESRATER